MDIRTLFDWVARVFGIVFLLFMVSALIFPSWREPGEDADEPDWDWYERERAQREMDRSGSTPRSGQAQEGGNVLTFPGHRRTHQ
jgi:hypothetical protein